MIKVDDILHFLVSRSNAPSTMGAQLERLRFGLSSTPDPFRAREDIENHLLEQATIIRCHDQFAQRPEFGEDYKALTRIQKATSPRLDQGYIAIGTLRAYHEWSSQSPERGLVEVYGFLQRIAHRIVPKLPQDAPSALQSFRENKAKRAKSLASEAYADSLLALQYHLRVYNKGKQ